MGLVIISDWAINGFPGRTWSHSTSHGTAYSPTGCWPSPPPPNPSSVHFALPLEAVLQLCTLAPFWDEPQWHMNSCSAPQVLFQQ